MTNVVNPYPGALVNQPTLGNVLKRGKDLERGLFGDDGPAPGSPSYDPERFYLAHQGSVFDLVTPTAVVSGTTANVMKMAMGGALAFLLFGL